MYAYVSTCKAWEVEALRGTGFCTWKDSRVTQTKRVETLRSHARRAQTHSAHQGVSTHLFPLTMRIELVAVCCNLYATVSIFAG